MGRRKYANM